MHAPLSCRRPSDTVDAIRPFVEPVHTTRTTGPCSGGTSARLVFCSFCSHVLSAEIYTPHVCRSAWLSLHCRPALLVERVLGALGRCARARRSARLPRRQWRARRFHRSLCAHSPLATICTAPARLQPAAQWRAMVMAVMCTSQGPSSAPNLEHECLFATVATT